MIKNDEEAINLDYNIALVYYYTQDFKSAYDLLYSVNQNADKYLLSDLKWKSDYYLIQVNNLLNNDFDVNSSYSNLITEIESIPKGYKYNLNDNPLIEPAYKGYIDFLIQQTNYQQALIYLEKKKNFYIKDLFLSYPFDLNIKDNETVKYSRDQDQNILQKNESDKDELFQKFDNKKQVGFKTEIAQLRNDELQNLQNNLKENQQLLYFIQGLNMDFNSINHQYIEFYISNTNLNIFIINKNQVDVLTLPINYKKFIAKIQDLKNHLIHQEDITPLKEYFETNFINALKEQIDENEYITIIPDDVLYDFPFHVFFQNKKINYDISLIQSLLNNSKEASTFQNNIVLDNTAKLSGLGTIKISNKELALAPFLKLFQIGSIIHFPDRFEINNLNPMNYKIYYNNTYNYSIDDIMKDNIKSRVITFDQLPDNFLFSEKEIYSLSLPFYYLGASTLILNCFNVNEKYTYDFWYNFYNSTNDSFIDKFYSTMNFVDNAEKKI